MRNSCLKEEIRKILYHKTWLFVLILCMLFNVGLILVTSGKSTEFRANLQEIQNQLGEEIFKNIDGRELGSLYYDERYVESDILVKLIQKKYQKLEGSLEKLAEEQADLSTYAGEFTPYIHRALFVYLMKALLIEGILLFTFLLLEAFFTEYHNKTFRLVYSSFRGRRMVFDKMFAVLLMGMLGMMMVSILSYFLFFQIWDFTNIWDSNVASSFNYIMDEREPIFMKPFITWTSFTVKQYWIASFVLMLGIWLAWWLFGMTIVLLNKRVSVAVAILSGYLILPFFVLVLLSNIAKFPELFFFNTLSITANVYYSHMWFTDLGHYSVFPWQETLSVVLHLLLGVLGVRMGYALFIRKDLQ